MSEKSICRDSRLPLVAIGTLGGTIAMTESGESCGLIKPELEVEQLTASVPSLKQIAQIMTRSICNVPSPFLSVDNVSAALDFANYAIQQGADGVVLTQGTDTLEESAYLLDFLWTHEAPLVVTGAMRSSSHFGADGAMNLHDSVVTAVDPGAQGIGVLVVMAGEVHLASKVTKAHSIDISAFLSPSSGLIGSVREGRLYLSLLPAIRYAALLPPSKKHIAVPIVETPFGDDGALLAAAITLDPQAIVLSAAGAGHVPRDVLPTCDVAIRRGLPLIFASRAGSGGTLCHTYGYDGAEKDLIRRGAIPAGAISPRKARLSAYVLSAADSSVTEIRREFALRGK